MESTKVIFNHDSIYGEVQLFSDGKKAGKMDVSLRNRKFRVFHTEINPGYGGRGFAKLLLDQLVSYARENNLRIIPLFCPYVLTQFNRHPEEYADVWLSRALSHNE